MEFLFYIKHVLFIIFGQYKYKFDKQWDDLLRTLIIDGTVIKSGYESIMKFHYGDKYYDVSTGDKLEDYASLIKVHNTQYSYDKPEISYNMRFRPSFKIICALMELELAVDRLDKQTKKAEIYGAKDLPIEKGM